MSARLSIEPGAIAARHSATVRVDLVGRFMLPSKQEHDCRILAMSTGEMLIDSGATPRLGDQVIVYVSALGRFEGVVDRHETEGFALRMALPPMKHGKLAEQLEGIANRGERGDPRNIRRHKRFVPLMRLTTVRLANGKESMARINDLSASGVNIEFNSKLAVMEKSTVLIGSKAATVLRIFEGGFVAEFHDAFEEDTIDERTTL